ncbi:MULTISPECIES: HpaII family restriction endonuclease [Acinetobacter]|nr:MULTISPECIES: HpaII family restriction endonuclease [Acinetobacter]MBT0886998.1 HpaII family restriction endonuclease [Acinetobacter towneri]NWJ92404.1 HpaII family restriction endonuclease [Acinetobacter sp. Swhac1]
MSYLFLSCTKYNNTKFEMASKTKHDFGQLFLKDNKLYLSLNLQIRFK